MGSLTESPTQFRIHQQTSPKEAKQRYSVGSKSMPLCGELYWELYWVKAVP